MGRGLPTPPKGGKPGARGGKRPGATSGPDKAAKHAETAEHAQQVRAVMRGRDVVDHDRRAGALEQKPPAFQDADLLVVRSWLQRRPLEPARPSAALVHFPRMWNTRRGRYCRFVAPGAGAYGLLRARPTF